MSALGEIALCIRRRGEAPATDRWRPRSSRFNSLSTSALGKGAGRAATRQMYARFCGDPSTPLAPCRCPETAGRSLLVVQSRDDRSQRQQRSGALRRASGDRAGPAAPVRRDVVGHNHEDRAASLQHRHAAAPTSPQDRWPLRSARRCLTWPVGSAPRARPSAECHCIFAASSMRVV